MEHRKIINLGLPRTGTQSLHKALQILGYSSRHYAADLGSFEGYRAVCEVNTSVSIGEIVHEDRTKK